MAKTNSNQAGVSGVSGARVAAGASRGARLSSASTYEQMFRTRHRTAGRPRREDGEPLFGDLAAGAAGSATGGAGAAVLRRIAERRAYAVVHEEQRARLREVFEAELKVLKRRGVEEVARDAGIRLELAEESAGGESASASAAAAATAAGSSAESV